MRLPGFLVFSSIIAQVQAFRLSCPTPMRTPGPLSVPTRSRVLQCKEPEYIFRLSSDRREISFGCRQQTLTMVKPEASGSLQEFIGSSSDTIVISSWDAGQVRRREGTEDEYLIRCVLARAAPACPWCAMVGPPAPLQAVLSRAASLSRRRVEEFDFVALKFAVELHVRCMLDERTTTTSLESLGFRLIGPGLDSIAEGIDVRVRGRLRPTAPGARLCALQGDVQFVASGELPPVLQAAPEPALRAAANAMSRSLINAAAERFGEKVPRAYATWARERAAGAPR